MKVAKIRFLKTVTVLLLFGIGISTTNGQIASKADRESTENRIKMFGTDQDFYPKDKLAVWSVEMTRYWNIQLDKAIKRYNKALEIDPTFPQAHEMLGWAYYEKKEYEKAIENWNISANKDADVLKYKAKAQEALDQQKESQRAYHKAPDLESLGASW